jgi:hypothetical protein
MSSSCQRCDDRKKEASKHLQILIVSVLRTVGSIEQMKRAAPMLGTDMERAIEFLKGSEFEVIR